MFNILKYKLLSVYKHFLRYKIKINVLIAV